MIPWTRKPSTEYREVGGELVSGTIADSRTRQVEVLARRAIGPISWRFRQTRLALFWLRSGLKELHLELDGRRIDSKIRKGTDLTLLPASTSVVGEFEVSPRSTTQWPSSTRPSRPTPAVISIGP